MHKLPQTTGALRVSVLEKKCTLVQKEKELIEKKMQRIEKAKDQEVQELRDKLEASQGDVRANLKAKDDKINEASGFWEGSIGDF